MLNIPFYASSVEYKKYRLKEASGMPTETSVHDNNYASQSQPENDEQHHCMEHHANDDDDKEMEYVFLLWLFR